VYQILEVGDEWNILKCTLHWRRVQTISIILAILEEFLVISIFHEKKFWMVDMKVQVYSKFRKNKNWKKIKSSSSMRNGRIHPTKYRGKFHKMGWCRGIPSKSQAFATYFWEKKIEKRAIGSRGGTWSEPGPISG
jgi:hypothetical protein